MDCKNKTERVTVLMNYLGSIPTNSSLHQLPIKTRIKFDIDSCFDDEDFDENDITNIYEDKIKIFEKMF